MWLQVFAITSLTEEPGLRVSVKHQVREKGPGVHLPRGQALLHLIATWLCPGARTLSQRVNFRSGDVHCKMEHTPLRLNPFQYKCYFLWTWHLSVLQYQRLSLGTPPWCKFPNLNTTIRLTSTKSLEQSWWPNPCLWGAEPHNPDILTHGAQFWGNALKWPKSCCLYDAIITSLMPQPHMTLVHIIEKKLNSCVQLPLFCTF